MKTYTNKTDRVDDRKCLYSEIKKGDKARKKAKRKEGKDEIKKELMEALNWKRGCGSKTHDLKNLEKGVHFIPSGNIAMPIK